MYDSQDTKMKGFMALIFNSVSFSYHIIDLVKVTKYVQKWRSRSYYLLVCFSKRWVDLYIFSIPLFYIFLFYLFWSHPNYIPPNKHYIFRVHSMITCAADTSIFIVNNQLTLGPLCYCHHNRTLRGVGSKVTPCGFYITVHR